MLLLRPGRWVCEGGGVGKCGAQDVWCLGYMRRTAAHSYRSPAGPDLRCRGSNCLAPLHLTPLHHSLCNLHHSQPSTLNPQPSTLYSPTSTETSPEALHDYLLDLVGSVLHFPTTLQPGASTPYLQTPTLNSSPLPTLAPSPHLPPTETSPEALHEYMLNLVGSALRLLLDPPA